MLIINNDDYSQFTIVLSFRYLIHYLIIKASFFMCPERFIDVIVLKLRYVFIHEVIHILIINADDYFHFNIVLSFRYLIGSYII